MTNRCYRIWRDKQGIVHCQNPEGSELKPMPVHSPTGFEFGYGGSGPAELALCILTDHLGRDVADSYYQRFKWDKIARVNEAIKGFTIFADEIDNWVKERKREEG